ncbi:hypothetical protein SADUNF_Sadunf16G0019400 [Salix dunnii]|uniref:Uncharacterized protein n=1 Tax=Salix dunnii TaxID=1413687 RepID=A0A835J8N2_9ROSI|nr:hypothetical protein SADUNF_Sadunf16G0019400 [Salix dunnii]
MSWKFGNHFVGLAGSMNLLNWQAIMFSSPIYMLRNEIGKTFIKEKGLNKEVSSSWIVIIGSVARFASKVNTTQSDKIYEMLEGLAMEMEKNDHRPQINP